LRRTPAGQCFLPSVSQTAASFARYFGRPYPAQGRPLWYDALTSLRRILIGFSAGTVIGVALGAGMSASRVVRHASGTTVPANSSSPPGVMCGTRMNPSLASAWTSVLICPATVAGEPVNVWRPVTSRTAR
jgi:hypothetical protein